MLNLFLYFSLTLFSSSAFAQNYDFVSFPEVNKSVGQVYLNINDKNGMSCGGVLIAKNLVLTALHCVTFNAKLFPAEFILDKNNKYQVLQVYYSYMPKKPLDHQKPTSNDMYSLDLALLLIEEVDSQYKPINIDFEDTRTQINAFTVGFPPSLNFDKTTYYCEVTMSDIFAAGNCPGEHGMSGSPLFNYPTLNNKNINLVGITITNDAERTFYVRLIKHQWIKRYLPKSKSEH